jgi:phosphatidylserine decarboxylase
MESHENGKFSVASMYNAMIVSDLPVLNNKKILKMIPLKNNFFACIYVGGLFLVKIILLNGIDM